MHKNGGNRLYAPKLTITKMEKRKVTVMFELQVDLRDDDIEISYF